MKDFIRRSNLTVCFFANKQKHSNRAGNFARSEFGTTTLLLVPELRLLYSNTVSSLPLTSGEKTNCGVPHVWRHVTCGKLAQISPRISVTFLRFSMLCLLARSAWLAWRTFWLNARCSGKKSCIREFVLAYTIFHKSFPRIRILLLLARSVRSEPVVNTSILVVLWSRMILILSKEILSAKNASYLSPRFALSLDM